MPVLCDHRSMADRPRPALGFVIALAALVISSCGSSSTKNATATASGTGAATAQFIAGASAICQRVAREEQPLRAREESLKNLPVATADEEFVSLAREAAAISQAAEEKLGALPRPPADAQTIQQLLLAYAEESREASSIASAAARQENGRGEDATGALTRSIALHDASAKKLGMGDCFVLE